MKDQDKTRPTAAAGQQLVSELTELRQRIAELEALETGRKRAEAALRRERERAEQLLQALNQAALAMSKAPTPEEIFAAVVEDLKALGFSCMIFLTDESQSRLAAEYVGFETGLVRAGEKLTGLTQRDFSFPVEDVDVYREVVWQRKTVLIKEGDHVMRQALPGPVKRFAGQLVRMLKIPRSIAAPLIAEDEVIGVLSVHSNDLVESDIPAITAFAHQVVAAWRRARLYEQAQQEITQRKRAEEAYRTLVEQSLLGIMVFRNHRILFANQTAADITGYTVEELLAMSPPEANALTHPKDRARVMGYHRDRLAGKPAPSLYEQRVLRKDGSVRWVQAAANLAEYQGEPVSQVFYVDITERKRAEEERLAYLFFLESMEQVNRVIQQATDLEQMLRSVIETVFSIFDSDRAWLLYPCDPNAPSFRVPMECTRPEYPGALALNLEVPMAPGQAEDCRMALESEGPVAFGPGFERPVSAETARDFFVQSQMFMALYPRVGKPWLFGMHQCSHAHVWTEEEQRLFKEIGHRITDGLSTLLFLRNLQESEERLKSTLASMDDLVFVLDKDGVLCDYYQPQDRSDLYVPPEVFLGKSFRDVMPPHVVESVDAAINTVMTFGTVQQVDYYLGMPEGTKWYSAKISIREDASGGFAGVTAVSRDITERKRAEEALRQQAAELEARNEELDAFAHTVAHDLKNPLARLIGYADLLKEAHPTLPDEQIDNCLSMVVKNGRRVNSIIDELLLLSSVRKVAEVKTHPLDMASIVAEVQDRLAPMIEEYQAEVVLPETWPVALGYGSWIEEVWANYLSNALKYGGQPPWVELGAMVQADGMVRFWVRDNGPGLSPGDQARLFTPFTRLDQVRAKGHGLGLSIVRRIVEKLGGQVSVESEIGQGSVFSFSLPR